MRHSVPPLRGGRGKPPLTVSSERREGQKKGRGWWVREAGEASKGRDTHENMGLHPWDFPGKNTWLEEFNFKYNKKKAQKKQGLFSQETYLQSRK